MQEVLFPFSLLEPNRENAVLIGEKAESRTRKSVGLALCENTIFVLDWLSSLRRVALTTGLRATLLDEFLLALSNGLDFSIGFDNHCWLWFFLLAFDLCQPFVRSVTVDMSNFGQSAA